MLTRSALRRPLPIVAAGVLVAALVGAGSATAATIITGRDVKDGSLGSADLRDGSVRVKDLRAAAVSTLRGQTGKTGPQGPQGPQGPAGDPAPAERPGWVGADWSVIDRNVVGNGDSALRPGPQGTGSLGIGSLGIRTGSPDDAASFGNQTAFSGTEVADITQIGFSVFTTAENNRRGPNNMPSIKLEIDPNVTDGGPNYTTLVYAPDNATASTWTAIDADADTGKHWGFTGGWFNPADATVRDQRCGINGSRCTWTEIQQFLAANNDAGQGPAKVTYSIAVGKGRDFAFSGAVDALRINDKVFDFEPLGVVTRDAG